MLRFRFGVFEADPASGELWKNARRVRVQELPFRLLVLLLEQAGTVVSREELRKVLWPADTFVEFDQGLNTAVKKLREALGDSADSPRFVETIPRKGYRFIAEVSVFPHPAVPAERHPTWRPVPARLLTALFVAGSLALVAAGVAVYLKTRYVEAPPWPRTLTSYPGVEIEPAFSPEGDSVAFSWSADGLEPFHISVKRPGVDRPVQLTAATSDDVSPSWSPDGRLIAFCRYRSNSASQVVVIPATGGLETQVASIHVLPGSQPRPFLTWTPDSKSLVLSDLDEGVPAPASGSVGPPRQVTTASLFLVSLETGGKKRLSFPALGSAGDSAPAFSPDGRRLAFTRSSRLGIGDVYVVSVSRDFLPVGEPQRLTSTFGFATSPAWTPDGQEIVFATGLYWKYPQIPSRLWRVSASGRTPPVPLPFASDSAVFPAISRRGLLVFTQGILDTNIWRVELNARGEPVESSAKCVICSTRYDGIPRFSPDGKRIVFISDRSGSREVWTAGADGSNQSALTSMRAAVTGSPNYSADGSRVVFDSNKGGKYEIYSVSATGGTPRTLITGPGDNAVASYSHDGRWIYFTSNRTGTFQIWKMTADGGAPVQITKNGGRVAFESSDGHFLYYATTVREAKPNAIWRVPVEGGDELQLIPSAIPFSFGLGRDGIYFNPSLTAEGAQSIEYFSFADRSAKRLMYVERPAGRGISVSPDGRWLLFTRDDQVGADLMIVDRIR